jgi:hypothetical protein
VYRKKVEGVVAIASTSSSIICKSNKAGEM